MSTLMLSVLTEPVLVRALRPSPSATWPSQKYRDMRFNVITPPHPPPRNLAKPNNETKDKSRIVLERVRTYMCMELRGGFRLNHPLMEYSRQSTPTPSTSCKYA